MASRCPECGGKLKFEPSIKHLVCQSCGLSLTRHELDMYWQKVRNENTPDADDSQRKKSRRKEWLEWYSKSKTEKENF
jgi:transcription initiation factor TFIIIB Brf1 subunit/transcription initiation factor TFIIB